MSMPRKSIPLEKSVTRLFDLIDEHNLPLAEVFDYVSAEMQHAAEKPTIFTGEGTGDEITDENESFLDTYNKLAMVVNRNTDDSNLLTNSTKNIAFAKNAVATILGAMVDDITAKYNEEVSIEQIEDIISDITENPTSADEIFKSGKLQQDILASISNHFFELKPPSILEQKSTQYDDPIHHAAIQVFNKIAPYAELGTTQNIILATKTIGMLSAEDIDTVNTNDTPPQQIINKFQRAHDILQSIYLILLKRTIQETSYTDPKKLVGILAKFSEIIGNKDKNKLIQYLDAQHDISAELLIQNLVNNLNEYWPPAVEEQKEKSQKLKASPTSDQPPKNESKDTQIEQQRIANEEKLQAEKRKNILNKKIAEAQEQARVDETTHVEDTRERSPKNTKQKLPTFFSLADQLPRDNSTPNIPNKRITPLKENDDDAESKIMIQETSHQYSLIQILKNAESLPIGHLGPVDSLGDDSLASELAAELETVAPAPIATQLPDHPTTTQPTKHKTIRTPETKAPPETKAQALKNRMINYAMEYVITHARDDYPNESAKEFRDRSSLLKKNDDALLRTVIQFLNKVLTSNTTNNDEKVSAKNIITAINNQTMKFKDIVKQTDNLAKVLIKKYQPVITDLRKNQDIHARQFILEITGINPETDADIKKLEPPLNQFARSIKKNIRIENFLENLHSSRLEKMKHASMQIISSINKIYDMAYHSIKRPPKIDALIAETLQELASLDLKAHTAAISQADLKNILEHFTSYCGLKIEIISDDTGSLRIKPSDEEDRRLKFFSALMSYTEHLDKIARHQPKNLDLIVDIKSEIELFTRKILTLKLNDPNYQEILEDTINQLQTKSLTWDKNLNEHNKRPQASTRPGLFNRTKSGVEVQEERNKAIRKVFGSLARK